MAQYYQVTSLEELHRLYPNLQLDNLEGISCMIQDDQVAHYTDGQGQQVIATVEQSGMQLNQNPPVSRCSPQQSQFVVHQPTQYVIQQMDATESQAPPVQYIQQRSIDQNKKESSETQVKDQNMGCSKIATDIGNEDETLHQRVVKQEGSQQFVPQVQPVLHSPIQISQQIQTVDMGPNILVLQNPEQQELFINSNKGPELLVSQEKQQQTPHQIIVQNHQDQTAKQMVVQRDQIIDKNENSQEFTQHQILQNQRPSQSGGQQQVIHHQQQPVIQQLQYYNQVTVLDSFSQPNVTIEHHASANESLPQQHLVRPQVQQFRPKKPVQTGGLPTAIQDSQVLMSQRFEMSSSRVPLIRKKVPQDVQGSQPVFVVQKVDSPYLIRPPQAKIRGLSSGVSSDEVNDTSYQSMSLQTEQNLEVVKQENQGTQSPLRSGQQVEGQQKTMVAVGQSTPIQVTKFPADRNSTCGHVKIGIVEQPFGSRVGDQASKAKVATPVSAKIPRLDLSRIKSTEQQTDPVNEGKEIDAQQFQRWTGNVQPQSQSSTILPSQQQSSQNQIQVFGRGRGIRGPVSPRGGHQYVPRAHGVQVQTSPPRLPNVKGGGIGRRLKSPRGGGKGGRGGWVPCRLDQRATTPIRVATPQVIHNPGTKVESSETSNENVEDARMVVVFLNGEKKVLKIPCSQPNILLGQILQQAGIVTTPTSLAIEQIADPNSEHFVVKGSPGNNRQPSTTFAPNQTVNVSTPIGMPKGVVAAIQHRPRGHSPVLPQATNVGIIRQRLHFAHSRVTSPNVSLPTTVTSNLVAEGVTSQAQNSPSSTLTSQPPKELPRFVSGFMAICPFCGISSLDFNKCIRCRRKLPENVKSQSIFCVKKKKADKAVGNIEKSDDGKFELEDKQLSDTKEKNLLQGYDRKKPKPCLKKKKISDEPAEILILSSDEEEDTKTKKFNLTSVSTVLRKEPVYTSVLSEADMANILKESNLNEDLMKNIQPGSFTTLQCRTIRVGSYKVQPKERVLISTKGLKLVVNSLKNENATIIIPITDILKTLIHFGKQIPVIFIYPIPKVGFQIRNILGMENKMGPYYDPTSTQEETHKRITLLLEKITEDNKMALFKIFGQSKIEELSEKEANEILIRASPVDIQNPSLNKLADGVRKIMVYPPPPEKGGITLNNQDYACLGEDQFLNDVIIDFYLKYLMLQVLSPTDRNRTHVFSTFFYKRLTTKPKTLRKNDPENDPKLSPAEKRHMRVKGWTKQVNLFEKDFIIVPINEHSHWFLAIICFPGLTGPVKFSDNTPVDPEEVTPKKSSHSVQIGSTTITHIIKTDGNKIEMDSVSDRDEAEGDQDDLHPSSEDEENEQAEEESNAASQSVQIPLLTNVPLTPSGVAKDAKAKVIKKKPLKEPIKQPCILIFDSLAGASRVRVVATLRDYLKIEYKMKMGQDRTFSKDTIKGAVPKVPQQNNFTDCGLYVLQYVESFFQDPLHDFKLPLKYLQEWFSEEVVSYKRQKLAYLIRSLMQEQGINVEEMGLPVLTFSNGSVPPGESGRVEDEEMDEEEINEDEELNEEDEEMLRNRIQISAFVNEDDEDLNLEDEDDDLEDDELDEDLDEEEEDELEMGEMRWIAKGSHSCIESESSIRHGGKRIIKTSPLVDYEPSDSDDDGQILCHNSEIIGEDPTTVHPDLAEDREYSESEPSLVSESIKSVPLTEFQDFESQITCTTIERNVEGKNTESDMMINEGEEEEEEEEGEEAQSSKATDEKETSFKTPNYTGTDNLNQSLGRNMFRSTELVTGGGSMEVTNIIKKLVNDKNITISRKEDDLNLNLNKKQLDLKRFKVKDCDKSEEAKKATSSYSSQKNNVGSCKRSFQALKNVRIQKKTERKLDVCSKRQKVDER